MTETPASHLDDAVAEMALVARDGTSTTEAFENAVRGVWEAASRATPAAASQAVRTLLPLLSIASAVRAGFVALCCGGLVERGAEADIALTAVLERLNAVLPEAAAFAAAAWELSASQEPAGLDPTSAVDDFGNQVAAERPTLAWAWSAADLFGRAAIAMLGRSKSGRQAARGNASLTAGLARLSAAQPLAEWLGQLLAILDDEELLVLHPGLKRGYRVKISGVADNFQLCTLLAGALLGDPTKGWLPGQPPGADILAAARGEAIVGENLLAEIPFRLLGWRGLQARTDLPVAGGDAEHFILGESLPADIEPFEGVRVVLVEEAPNVQAWPAEASFPGLRAEAQVVEKLDPEAVETWLRRLAQAANPG